MLKFIVKLQHVFFIFPEKIIGRIRHPIGWYFLLLFQSVCLCMDQNPRVYRSVHLENIPTTCRHKLFACTIPIPVMPLKHLVRRALYRSEYRVLALTAKICAAALRGSPHKAADSSTNSMTRCLFIIVSYYFGFIPGCSAPDWQHSGKNPLC